MELLDMKADDLGRRGVVHFVLVYVVAEPLLLKNDNTALGPGPIGEKADVLEVVGQMGTHPVPTPMKRYSLMQADHTDFQIDNETRSLILILTQEHVLNQDINQIQTQDVTLIVA